MQHFHAYDNRLKNYFVFFRVYFEILMSLNCKKKKKKKKSQLQWQLMPLYHKKEEINTF